MRIGGARLLSAGLRAGLVVAIGWFYLWTVAPEPGAALVGRTGDGYYNLLVRGMLKGHLYLDAAADPFLATLKNPWDPAERQGRGMHDISYYRGRYYLYFGAAPIFLLFLPFRLLTGLYLSEGLASLLFVSGGFVISAGLFEAIRRRYFPRTPAAAALGCLAALGLANMVPVLLRRASVWEVPISCGYACTLAALAAIYRSFHSRRPAAWLAAGAAALGLAVASRPVYLFGCPAILLPLAWEARRRGLGWRCWRDPAWRGRAAAALAPLLFVGGLLAGYNYLRFGNPGNFGFRYNLAGENTATEQQFAWRFLGYNLRVYGLAPAAWGEYFPFVATARLPPPPAGHLGVEDPFGILPNMPFVLLALGALLLARGAERSRTPLGVFAAIIAVVAIGPGLCVSAFGGADNRYMVDFAPALVLLACLGFLVLAAAAPRGRLAVLTAGGLLAAYSSAFNVFASMRHNELFRAEHPQLYARVAHRWNWASELWDRWRGTAYGPVAMTVVFPANRTGKIEPLVVTGHSFLSDYLFVHYLGPDSLRFGLEHTSRGTYWGPAVPYQPGRPHALRIDLGSLYPPAAHPYFDAFSPAEARLRQETVRVILDGVTALDWNLVPYDAAGPAPSIGSAGDRPAFREAFSGRILARGRLPEAARRPLYEGEGPLRLGLVLPPFAGARSEPLAASGQPARGDLVYVHYEAADRVWFGYDHGGEASFRGPLLAVVPGADQSVAIDWGALRSGAADPGRIEVRLNGLTALGLSAPWYRAGAGTVAVGLNTPESPGVGATFRGTVLSVKRKGEPAAQPSSGPLRLRLMLPSFTGPRSEPLVCSGRSGRGDLLYVRYETPDRVSFGYDHWSVGGPQGPACAVDPRAAQDLEIDFGALHPGPAAAAAAPQSGRVQVRLNGRVALDAPALWYPADPATLAIGINAIGSSAAGPAFTGELAGIGGPRP